LDFGLAHAFCAPKNIQADFEKQDDSKTKPIQNPKSKFQNQNISMSVAVEKERRQRKRSSLLVSAVVKAKENKDSFWKETTELISVSRMGAGFYLENKCEVGRLISLMMPMPKQLRCYDIEKELYRVWGLVQHCSPVSGDAGSMYHVGVAFAGKESPQSYNENPLQSYRIAGMNEDGTWRVVESKTNFVVRRHPRHWVSLRVLLSAFDANDKLMMDEDARTENVSLSGAAVFSNMNVDVGDSVTFDSIEHNFSSLAVVRNRQTPESDADLPKIHLEFVGDTFPVERLLLPVEKDAFEEA
jgi:hypothetical protein